jgi:hypothetical protein
MKDSFAFPESSSEVYRGKAFPESSSEVYGGATRPKAHRLMRTKPQKQDSVFFHETVVPLETLLASVLRLVIHNN